MKSTVALLARRTLPVGVHRAAPQHQLQEPGVVGGGGDQAPPADSNTGARPRRSG